VELQLETEAQGLLRARDRITGVLTNRGTYYTGWVVNCAGVNSDEVMSWAGLNGFEIRPRRGQYYVFDKSSSGVKQILFPCPTPVSKGILVTPTTHGNTLIGPNAEDTGDKRNHAVSAEGLSEVLHGAQKLVPSLEARDVIAVFAGIRPSGSTGDFLIEVSRQTGGFVNIAGIDSPGLTAAPAIAEWVVEVLQEEGMALDQKQDYNPVRRAAPRFLELSRREQVALVEQDPRYGRIVCRCEMVTEGEVVRAIHAPVPARTYDAIKRRTRCGTGRCQGGFDTPRVIKILARELGISPLDVTKKGLGSELLLSERSKMSTDFPSLERDG
jgi:glycerol-3-phosphate dehydrogenase